jgi:alpha-glucoside transport system permease protein
VGTTATDADGSFAFNDVGTGDYLAAIGSKTFAKPFGGVSWLGPKLHHTGPDHRLHLGVGGVLHGGDRGGLPRFHADVLEAARTDGAGEWQVFRRVHRPAARPFVLTVVFVTMLINRPKVFDIVLAIAPGSVQDDANVIALAMWRVLRRRERLRARGRLSPSSSSSSSSRFSS